ncbi:Arylsulfatase precursor [Maioricimonas rarisocia]|uniref:Arylsulfatase n=1 Tax=Maioricimonas rarisocia TaxID=2528026 RepID=A0A517Z3F9_9PLAN|nr:arylsulfatase [Maioricimonas rarisocia]QDU37011.1 Arylsulfatase precursor [Maioricimonas rarisocia]
MTRMTWLAIVAIIWLGLSAQTARAADERPNIIFIMADDLGYAELGSYGQTKIRTPYLDRLAEEGMRFTQYYSGAPVCAPARCVLMTGKHLGHSYVRDNSEVGTWESFQGQIPLPAGEKTVAEVLKEAGYVTGAFGKWGLGRVGSSGDPLNQGFDRFFGYNCQRHAHNYYPRYLIDDREQRPLEGNDRGLTGEQYAPQLIADELLKFLRANHDQPFFIYYPTVIPHLALQVPEDDVAAYRGEWEETPYEGRSYLPHPTPKAAYAAMITFMDRQVGRILESLDELGVAENTLVVFTSDNGTTMLKPQVDYEFFESVGPLRGLKGSVYEGGLRVPLIARWPGKIPAGTVSDHQAVHYDVLATLAEVAGAEVPAGTDGISFLPELRGNAKQQKEHEYLFWDFGGYGGQIAVRMGDWKGVKRNLRRKPDAPLELYNLAEDIGEQNNVAAEHPEVAAKIEEIILEARDVPEVEKFRFGRYRE